MTNLSLPSIYGSLKTVVQSLMQMGDANIVMFLSLTLTELLLLPDGRRCCVAGLH